MLKLIIRLAYIATMFVEALVMTRIILLALNASLENQFASWVMNTSSMFVEPFEGIVSNSIGIASFTLPLTPVVALLFYIVAAFILSELLKSFARD